MHTTQKNLSIFNRFCDVRELSEKICAHLNEEDCNAQSMPDVSPLKWHLAHTTWFFETFILKENLKGYQEFHPNFTYLFNSYYNSIGERHARSERGNLTRPSLSEVYSYRKYVDQAIKSFIQDERFSKHVGLLEVGLNHEQQHQELMLTDIKHVFSKNLLHPVYWANTVSFNHTINPLNFNSFEKGIYHVGHSGEGFGYDNEFPKHEKLVHAFKVANRLITNAEYLNFINDGGYSKPQLWLSDGWDQIQQNKWSAPLYWKKESQEWYHFTLNGYVPVNPSTPVCHVSFYEADAFARWAAKRLPTEEEWEVAFKDEPVKGNFLEQMSFSPRPLQSDNEHTTHQAYGDVWEWTASSYQGYPGYKPEKGALGEYNGKFMINQMVLKGGSCATPQNHIRLSYRNFFYPQQRWQFMGIRLADNQ